MDLLESEKTYFKVLHLAGEGLNSCVYKAIRQDATGTISQEVALKVLKSKNSVSFWRQEVQSLLEVSSPYCVKVYGFEWVDQKPAVVLEWLEGLNLFELAKESPLDPELVREIVCQVQKGLIDLHMMGLCHGDLHPGNIFVTTSGEIKLIDFGWANVSRCSIQGSPEFRAPELCNKGARPNLFSDLYSLGKISELLGVEALSLTQSSPRARHHQGDHPQPIRQSQIARAVLRVLNLKKIEGLNKTVLLNTQEQSKPHISFKPLRFFIFSAFLLATGASSKTPLHRGCFVEVRTKNWVQILLPSAEWVYAPIKVRYPSCSPIKIHWKNGRASGSLIRYVGSGLKLKISDKDFSLDLPKSN